MDNHLEEKTEDFEIISKIFSDQLILNSKIIGPSSFLAIFMEFSFELFIFRVNRNKLICKKINHSRMIYQFFFYFFTNYYDILFANILLVLQFYIYIYFFFTSWYTGNYELINRINAEIMTLSSHSDNLQQ